MARTRARTSSRVHGCSTKSSKPAARSIRESCSIGTESNTGTLADPADASFDDWFELYNAGDVAVDLGGYFLTDNLGNRNQYRIPTNGNYVIPAGGYLLVWADNDPNQNSEDLPDLHADFQLSRSGEAIGLFSPDGQTIAFSRRRGRESQVFVIDADGGNLRQLTNEGNNSSPSWQPLPATSP